MQVTSGRRVLTRNGNGSFSDYVITYVYDLVTELEEMRVVREKRINDWSQLNLGIDSLNEEDKEEILKWENGERGSKLVSRGVIKRTFSSPADVIEYLQREVEELRLKVACLEVMTGCRRS